VLDYPSCLLYRLCSVEKEVGHLVISTSAVPHLDLRFNGEDENWTNHIDNIVNAAFKQVNVLRKLKFTLSKQTLSNIYITVKVPFPFHSKESLYLQIVLVL
jgi:hypothetical protein